MGTHNTRELDKSRLQAFTQALLEDVRALERILDEGLIETGVRRIGAEQEMFLLNESMGPALVGQRLLAALDHPKFTPELGLFNLEANLVPRVLTGDCLSQMEAELEGLLALVREKAATIDTQVLLTGILPTLKSRDLNLKSMTPFPRYELLNRAALEHRGGAFQVDVKGLDELHMVHDNVMIEACNTSFQVHFQVAPHEFPRFYNLAQAITGPVLAAAVNSPVFMQQRLWKETRVALFSQSFDSRSAALKARRARPRVIFGDEWVSESVLEIHREDIARFRILLSADTGESPMAMLDKGLLPPLRALCLHNGTVYRWNRPCYGVVDNVAHLRIEHRALPAGPTIVDEVANAAFFHGLMSGLGEEYPDITKVMNFDHAKSNFLQAAQYGLQGQFEWVGGEDIPANVLILERLLPVAREGLRAKGILEADIERYLGVIEGRVKAGRTGAQWVYDSLEAMGDKTKLDERHRSLTACMVTRCAEGRPVHEWALASADEGYNWRESCRTVDQIMTTDLFTIGPEDIVDLAASVMDWEHVRHVPVEDKNGLLVGIVSHRQLLRLVGKGLKSTGKPVIISDIMMKDPVTVTPDMSTADCIDTMRRAKVACVPVVDEGGKLVGIVTERDFIDLTAQLLEERLRQQ